MLPIRMTTATMALRQHRDEEQQHGHVQVVHGHGSPVGRHRSHTQIRAHATHLYHYVQ